MNVSGRVFDYVWKLIASGLAFAIASFAAGAILTAIGLQVAAMPGEDMQKSALIGLALGPLLALGVAPLAAGLAGSYSTRWQALGLLVFVTLGLNTVIELEIFSTLLAKGGTAFMVLMYLAASVPFAVLIARFFGPSPVVRAPKPHRGALSWAWRGVLAVLAFPVIYFIFGMMVAPFVVPSYRAGVAGLTIPSMGVLLPVELVRSALSLLAALPIIFLWTGSRKKLILTLGWAFTVMVGLYGLVGAYFLPTVLRVAHSLEITADSFVYALVLVMLFKRRQTPAPAAVNLASPTEPAAA